MGDHAAQEDAVDLEVKVVGRLKKTVVGVVGGAERVGRVKKGAYLMKNTQTTAQKGKK
jgi:hypothetical protein